MELSHSSSMTWEDQVQKEEEQQRCSATMEGSPSLGSLPPLLEGDNTSDISMINDSLLQWDISVPRGHSDDSIALVISPGEDDL